MFIEYYETCVAAVYLSVTVDFDESRRELTSLDTDFQHTVVEWDGTPVPREAEFKWSDREDSRRRLLKALLAHKLQLGVDCQFLASIMDALESRYVFNPAEKPPGAINDRIKRVNKDFVRLFGHRDRGKPRITGLFAVKDLQLTISSRVLPPKSIDICFRGKESSCWQRAEKPLLEAMWRGIDEWRGTFKPQPIHWSSRSESIPDFPESPPIKSRPPSATPSSAAAAPIPTWEAVPIAHEERSAVEEDHCIRTALAGENGYLATVARSFEQFPWPRPPSSLGFFDRLHIRVQVAPNRTGIATSDRQNAQERAAMDEEDSKSRAYGNRATPESFPSSPDQSPKSWLSDQPSKSARQHHPWAVVLSDPGMGKTTLLRFEGWYTARKQIERLLAGQMGLDEVLIPVFIRQADLAEALSKDDLRDVLVDFALSPVGLAANNDSAAVREFVAQQIHRGKMLLLLDAHDEVRPDMHRDFDARLKAILSLLPERVYFSSRRAGYRGNPLQMSGRPAPELEIVAFSRPDIQRFVSGFFGIEGDRNGRLLADIVWGHLIAHKELMGLSQCPLLITMLCVVAWERARANEPLTTLPTRRGDLYRECIHGLLGGWSKYRSGEIVAPRVPNGPVTSADDFLQEFLAEFAWELPGYRQERTVFTRKEAFAFANRHPALLEAIGCEDSTAITDLLTRKQGVLLAEGSQLLLFLHLTFQEYFVAKKLADGINRYGWAAATVECTDAKQTEIKVSEFLDHVAWLPRWQEILPLLAGELRDPCPLLALLSDEERDDLFRHRLALAARCLVEIQTGMWQPTQRDFRDKTPLLQLTESIIDDTFRSSWTARQESPQFSTSSDATLTSHLESCLSSLLLMEMRIGRRSQWVKVLLSRVHSDDVSERRVAGAMLQSFPLEHGPWPIDDLLDSLASGNSLSRSVAARLVAAYDGPLQHRHIEELIRGIRDESPAVRIACAEALSRMKRKLSASQESQMAELLSHDHAGIRESAGQAMEGIAARLDDRFLTLVRDGLSSAKPGEKSAWVRAISGFGDRLVDSDIDILFSLLRSPFLQDRHAAAMALGTLEWHLGEHHLSRLRTMMTDSDSAIRYAATKVLSHMSGSIHPDFVNDLVISLADNDGGVRESAARAIARFAWVIQRCHVDTLCDHLASDNDGIRHAAAHAARHFSAVLSRSDIRVVVNRINDSSDGVCCAAAQSVGTMRNKLTEQHVTVLLSFQADADNSGDEKTQQLVVEALGPLSLSGSEDVLLELVTPAMADKLGMKYAAIQAIGELGERADERHVDVLLRQMSGKDWSSAVEAYRALRRWSASGVRVVREQSGLRPCSVYTLADIQSITGMPE